MGKPRVPKPDPVPVTFTKFEGGKMVTCQGTLEGILGDFIRIAYTDEEGTKHSVRFRRSPGSTSGWGVGPSKFWRIADFERKKYVHPDVPMRLRK